MVMELSGLKLHLFACLFFKLLIAQELRLWTQVLLDIINYEKKIRPFFSLSWTKVNRFFFFFGFIKSWLLNPLSSCIFLLYFSNPPCLADAPLHSRSMAGLPQREDGPFSLDLKLATLCCNPRQKIYSSLVLGMWDKRSGEQAQATAHTGR